MDSRLKQRLIGAAVLVALAVIFLPMLVQGPAPDSGVAGVPLSMPDAPRSAYETRDLPLVTPGETPDGGALGMQSMPRAQPVASPMPATVAPAAAPSAPTADSSGGAQTIAAGADAQPQPQAPATPQTAAPVAEAPLPAVSAAGDYAVNVGTYASQAAADAVLAALRAAQLPARREPAIASGKPAWRVRIGPYASRADAETARLRAAHVRDGAAARVVSLDAPPATDNPVAAATDAATDKPSVPTAVATPSPASAPAPAVQRATGFTVQLAAYAKPAEASALRDTLRAAGFTAFTERVDTDKGALTRVRVGPVISRAEADQLRAQVNAKVGMDGIVQSYP